MLHKIEAWAKEHKYLAIASGVAFLVLVYLLLHRSSSASSGPSTLAQQKLADQTQVELAHIQAGAAMAPGQQQTQQASIMAQAQEKLAQISNQGSTTIAGDALQQALAAITGQTTVATTQAADQLSAIENSNATSLGLGTLASQTALGQSWDQYLGIESNNSTAYQINQTNESAAEVIANLEATVQQTLGQAQITAGANASSNNDLLAAFEDMLSSGDSGEAAPESFYAYLENELAQHP